MVVVGDPLPIVPLRTPVPDPEPEPEPVLAELLDDGVVVVVTKLGVVVVNVDADE
jgi:hypothetical protein